ncbi:hypothetical protein [Cryptosporangium phraense]|uniref:Uncharacterized protein n=1 Tax=Cryptosporangium phraense TaxID=2593070 RepID=A0A545AYU0_9ACTN|nr:hypothetical protein [Cryptosporangium phraense]TQS45745.1 hypothetical protein FL583_08535 [Cryptosporangium phraense]
MIDQGLLTAASVYVGLLIVVGAVVLLALAAWGVRSSFRGQATRSPLTARAERHSSDTDDAVDRTPHLVH